MDYSHIEHFPNTRDQALAILPHVFDALGAIESAVDVGGGTGAWCSAMKTLGVSRVTCVDDPRVTADQLLITPVEFVPYDMSAGFPSPIRADLAMCIEVAEHLPASQGEPLVEFLTSCAEVVLFSAAIPGQPSPYHTNERPAEYWRRLFEQRGFARYDCIRPRIVADQNLPYWFRQNLYVFSSEHEAMTRRLRSIPFQELPSDFELIHTHVLKRYRSARIPTMRDLPLIIKRSLRTRLAR